MNRLSIVLGTLLASSAAIAQQPAKATADEAYHHRYTTAGYLRRAGAVCQNDNKRTVDAAMGLVSGDEMKAFSKSFPKKTRAWMTEGTEVHFYNHRGTPLRTAPFKRAEKAFKREEEKNRGDHDA